MPTGDSPVLDLRGANARNREGRAMAWFPGFRQNGTIGGSERSGLAIHDSRPVHGGRPCSHGWVRVGRGDEAERCAGRVNRCSRRRTTIVHIEGEAPTATHRHGERC
ncbi:MAG TPA: hypothetical protein VHF47_06005 [Acidimicrobiales bacterium]|nr:hypothetical protein [Acidimicrobiales bacterium]